MGVVEQGIPPRETSYPAQSTPPAPREASYPAQSTLFFPGRNNQDSSSSRAGITRIPSLSDNVLGSFLPYSSRAATFIRDPGITWNSVTFTHFYALFVTFEGYPTDNRGLLAGISPG